MDQQKTLVVGGGIAGVLIAEALRKRDKFVQIISSKNVPGASEVAIGTWNPVAFRRFILSWRAKEFLAEMKISYAHFEQLLGSTFVEIQDTKKFVKQGDELSLWEKQAKGEMKEYLGQTKKVDDEFHLGDLKASGRLHLQKLITFYKNEMGDDWLDEEFDYRKLEYSNLLWRYEGKTYDRVIFCEGIHVKENPYFNWLPLKPAKGEVITIKSPELKLNYTLKKNLFIMPFGDDTYEVGATYEWKDLNWNKTEEGKNQLITKLKKIISAPFEVVDHKAGIRPSSYDRRPILGEHPKHKNLYVFNGLGTKGVMLAPLMAKELADQIVDGLPLHPEADIQRCMKFMG